MANLGPRDTVVKIYEGDYETLLHTKYKSSGSHGFREEDFSHYNPMGAIRFHGNQSDLAQNRMQPFPHPNDASDKIDFDWPSGFRGEDV